MPDYQAPGSTSAVDGGWPAPGRAGGRPCPRATPPPRKEPLRRGDARRSGRRALLSRPWCGRGPRRRMVAELAADRAVPSNAWARSRLAGALGRSATAEPALAQVALEGAPVSRAAQVLGGACLLPPLTIKALWLGRWWEPADGSDDGGVRAPGVPSAPLEPSDISSTWPSRSGRGSSRSHRRAAYPCFPATWATSPGLRARRRPGGVRRRRWQDNRRRTAAVDFLPSSLPERDTR